MTTLIKSWYAFITLAKAMCGVGIFALPVAFQQAGIWVGTALTIALGFANAHCMIKLVKCSQYLSRLKESTIASSVEDSHGKTIEADQKRHNTSDSSKSASESDKFQPCESSDDTIDTKPKLPERTIVLDYGHMAEEAFAVHDSWLRYLAKPASIIVNLCLVLLQLGICSVFYIFVADHTKQVIDHFFSMDLDQNTVLVSILPFFIALSSVKSLIVMSWIAFLGNILVLGAILIIDVQLCIAPHIPLSDLAGVTTIQKAAVVAGSITYAYTCPALVLPLENKMRNPQRMMGIFGVISTSVASVGLLYVVTGFLGYFTYGDNIQGSITLNLTNNPLDFSVKTLLLLMTFCGYIIQHYPIIEMIWPTMERLLSGAHCCLTNSVNYTLRYTIVILSFALAYSIPKLEQIIPIIGVTTGMLLSFVIPATLETVVFWSEWRKHSILLFVFNVALNTFYIILGILFLVTGVYSNVQPLVNSGAL